MTAATPAGLVEKETRRWFLLTTDPNIQDEFNRFIVIEDVGDPIVDSNGVQCVDENNEPLFEYRTFMLHQEKDNVQGYPTGEWWERDRFEISRHLIVGHYEKFEDDSNGDVQMVTGWKTDKLVIFSDPPKFLQWESVEMPDEYVGVNPKAKSLVVRDTEAEQAALANQR